MKGKILLVALVLVALLACLPRPIQSASMLEYDDMIYYDYYTGGGGVSYPMGTKTAPLSNRADLKAVALATNIKRVHVHGPMTLIDQFPNFAFFGDSPQDAVANMNNQSVNFSSFRNLVLTGQQLFGSNDIYVHNSVVKMVTGLAANIWDSLIIGPTSLRDLSGDITLFNNCWSAIQEINGLPPNTYDVIVNRSNALFQNWSGHLVIKNMQGGTVEISSSTGAPVTLDPSCVSGLVRLYGNINLTNNAGAGVIVQDYTK